MVVRHSRWTEDGMYHILDDGLTAARFDTLSDLHKWVEETVADCIKDAKFYLAEAENAEHFATSLTEMVNKLHNV